MTRTEKLLAELIALPSVNPAFLPPRHPHGSRVKMCRGFSRRHRRARRTGNRISNQFCPDRSNLIARLRPRNKIRQTILLAPHLDTVGADGTQFIPQRKNGRLHGRGACDTKGSVAAMLTALCELAECQIASARNGNCLRRID